MRHLSWSRFFMLPLIALGGHVGERYVYPSYGALTLHVAGDDGDGRLLSGADRW